MLESAANMLCFNEICNWENTFFLQNLIRHSKISFAILTLLRLSLNNCNFAADLNFQIFIAFWKLAIGK